MDLAMIPQQRWWIFPIAVTGLRLSTVAAHKELVD
jgi:hypothetical protein